MAVGRFVAIGFILIQTAWAWGPHPEITRAAMNVLPERARWEEALGGETFWSLPRLSWLPDQVCQDLGEFYADDYLLFDRLPVYLDHKVLKDGLGVAQAAVLHFGRALQALRTESPREACRWTGPLLHYLEDAGAPPHAVWASGPDHGRMENWVRKDLIAIPGYAPRLLGTTDEAAVEGLKKRLIALVAFSAKRSEALLPMAKAGEAERAKMEPLILECALETSRAAADLLHTLLTLGTRKEPAGAALSGTVGFGDAPLHGRKGARVVLLRAGQGGLPAGPAMAAAATGYTTQTEDDGTYSFRNLPAGTYRVAACRVGSCTAVSQPIVLAKGRTATADLILPGTDPAGNVVQNADGTFHLLSGKVPDRWYRTFGWQYPRASIQSAIMVVPAGTAFRCGAVRKNAAVPVRFEFRSTLWGEALETVSLEAGTLRPAEEPFRTADKPVYVVAIVETEGSFTDAIDRIWLTPQK